MKKYLIAAFVILIMLLFASGGCLVYRNYLKGQPSIDQGMKEAELSREDAVNLTKPAVVRLVQHVKGKAELPDFKIDFEKFDITANPSGPIKTIDLDEYFTGSGFVVNSDGYIITNSHVVSYQTVKTITAGLYGKEVLLRELNDFILSGQGDKKDDVSSTQAEEMGEQLGKKILDYLVNQGKYELEKQVTVLNPSSMPEKKEDAVNQGFPARIVSVNDNFYKDNKDVALIKIDQAQLPSIRLGNSEKISVGNRVSIFGFPASAEFNGKNLLESTFTDGTINALKDSENKDFKIFQSDAKISQGSSGGPMVNERGEVIGLITYQSNDMQREAGDSFAFAIPIDAASAWISGFTVNPSLSPSALNETPYVDHAIKGLQLMQDNRCQKAIAEFNLAQNMNSNFATDKYLNGYVEKCNSIIRSGDSINTRWDEKKQELEKINMSTWYLTGGITLALIIAVFVIIFLLSRLKKDEDEMHHLEERVYSRDFSASPTPESPSSNRIPPVSPEISANSPGLSASPEAISFKDNSKSQFSASGQSDSSSPLSVKVSEEKSDRESEKITPT